eukprot:gnl/MRDRNA2_/MRDRNA2_86062_c0_seq1.p1 gnl/MRDRNA2_/MRDRNA2_86062_c0~~gnl/MRDRNA2_/MRDRNA2_86062_c0_seq1.p1  ORF type:complete len:545 (-),score=76.85 gnl/MRDRNA2_/MRDRNA2_86062_c0_seq1:133-1686(-)
MAGNEGDLMRTCAPLYPSFALEAVSSILLILFFSYILMLLNTSGKLQAPGRAFCGWVASNAGKYMSFIGEIFSLWSQVHAMPLMARFRWCRKCNEFVCSFSVIAAVISLTRLLHVGNISSFRYIGYAVTCPIMMVELVVLIGPVVPAYHVTAVITWSVTFVCLIAGYLASLQPGPVWEGHLINDFDLNTGRLKFWFALVSMGAFGVIMLILIYLNLLFHCGTCRRSNIILPWGYTQLLRIVAVTWVLFPVWWMLSFEGMDMLPDTRMNALGFALLNMTSKGLFTWQVLRMVRREKKRAAEAGEKIADAVNANQVSGDSDLVSNASSTSTQLWLYGIEVVPEKSLVVDVLKPFDVSKMPRSNVPKRSRRPSISMDDIPGSFALGHMKHAESDASPSEPTLEAPQRGSRSFNPSLPVLAETGFSPHGDRVDRIESLLAQHDIRTPSGPSPSSGGNDLQKVLEELTEIRNRLALIESKGSPKAADVKIPDEMGGDEMVGMLNDMTVQFTKKEGPGATFAV